MTVTKPPIYDKSQVKFQAAKRWPEILTALSGAPIDTFSGRQQPCPKCGGTDRFRLFADDTGGAICNQCFNSSNGDGFSTLAWLIGCDFAESIHRVAEYLHIAPEKPAKKTRKADPARDLNFDNEATADIANYGPASLWCSTHKEGLAPEALALAHGRIATYRDKPKYEVIALPIFGQGGVDRPAVGWCLYNVWGGKLPKFVKGQKPEMVKVKLTYGSQPGWIGTVDRIASASTIWKVEGPTDALAALSLAGLPDDVAIIANANGAKERPQAWMTDQLAGKTVYVLHDADIPGQQGATWVNQSDGQQRPGWCPAIAAKASECRNVMLPFEVAETKGKDLRDWIIETSATYAELLALAESGDLFEPGESPVQMIVHEAEPPTAYNPPLNEADDDPHRLARVALRRMFHWEDDEGTFWTLRNYQNEWFRWDGRRYLRLAELDLKSRLTAVARQEFERVHQENLESKSDSDDQVKPVKEGLISNVLLAIRSMVSIEDRGEGPIGYICENESEFTRSLSCRDWIAMKNGILDFGRLIENRDEDNDIADVLMPHTPRWFSAIHLPYDFRMPSKYPFCAQAECPKWNAFLHRNMEGDQERISLLQEWAGYLLTPDARYQKFLMLIGEGGNGKSVFLAAITAMLGLENVSAIGLEAFSQRFALFGTIGKLANFCADAGDLSKVAEGHIKAFTAGDRMTFDRKNKDPVTARPTARLVVSCNNRPRFTDRSQGIWRRMTPIPWNVSISEKEKIHGMADSQWWLDQGELPGMFWWAILGLARLKKQGRFTESEVVNKELQDYRVESNPARIFFGEKCVESTSSCIGTQELYEEYKRWCEKNGYKPMQSNNFGKEAKRHFPKSKKERPVVGGSRLNVYAGIELLPEI